MGDLVLERVLPGDVLAAPPRARWTLLAPILIGIVTFVAVLISSHLRSTPYNNYVLLADAWLHGHLWINWPGESVSDALLWDGRRYVIEGPIPAILILPFVAIFGEHANQTTLAAALCAIAVATAWSIARRLGASENDRLWLVVFLFAGTSLWWCSMLGDVWFIAHSSAVCFTMLAIRELLGRQRAWLVALLAVCAFESRFSMVLAVPFYALFLVRGGIAPEVRRPNRVVQLARLRALAFVLAPAAVLWVLYNEARWNLWYDVGYTAFYHQDSWGQPTGSPFRLAYLPYELYSFFLQAPVLAEYRQLAIPPFFKVDVHGLALTWTSPALVLAFLAKTTRKYRLVMWTLILVLWIPSLVYYLNGWWQFGMRHALDFEPFVFVLMAIGVRGGMPRWGKVLCVYCALVGAWGIWFWNATYRIGN